MKMWTPGVRQTEGNSDTCGTCGHEVEPEQLALECDICKRWKHVECVRRPDKIGEGLYSALKANQVRHCYSAVRRVNAKVVLLNNCIKYNLI